MEEDYIVMYILQPLTALGKKVLIKIVMDYFGCFIPKSAISRGREDTKNNCNRS